MNKFISLFERYQGFPGGGTIQSVRTYESHDERRQICSEILVHIEELIKVGGHIVIHSRSFDLRDLYSLYIDLYIDEPVFQFFGYHNGVADVDDRRRVLLAKGELSEFGPEWRAEYTEQEKHIIVRFLDEMIGFSDERLDIFEYHLVTCFYIEGDKREWLRKLKAEIDPALHP